MAELFRRLMDHAHRHLSPMVEERKLVEHYLAMESLRLGERMTVEWAWDPALDSVEAPPLLLQPLVENALKHGLSPCPEGGFLRIQATLQQERVHLKVENTGCPFTGRHGDGLGLRNLESRLDLAFDGDGVFTLQDLGDRTLASVNIPCLKELA
jgi:two-component system sensor histidine kinase AlgZ